LSHGFYDARHGTGRYAWTRADLTTTQQSRRRDVSGMIVATDAALAAGGWTVGDTQAYAAGGGGHMDAVQRP
jgi:hypothetical protein